MKLNENENIRLSTKSSDAEFNDLIRPLLSNRRTFLDPRNIFCLPQPRFALRRQNFSIIPASYLDAINNRQKDMIEATYPQKHPICIQDVSSNTIMSQNSFTYPERT